MGKPFRCELKKEVSWRAKLISHEGIFLLTHHKCKKMYKPYIVYIQTIFIHAGFDKAEMDLREFAIENEQ